MLLAGAMGCMHGTGAVGRGSLAGAGRRCWRRPGSLLHAGRISGSNGTKPLATKAKPCAEAGRGQLPGLMCDRCKLAQMGGGSGRGLLAQEVL